MGIRHPLQRLMPLLLMVASGFAGLGYQVVWTQQSALWLGHEAAGVLAVVTAFFGGLGVGSLLAGRNSPARWYAAYELVIALWSLVLAFAMAPVSTVLLDIIGAQPSPVWQWSVAFSGTFFLLLPATAAMGATLPAMERVTAELSAKGQPVASLYAANTFGAVLGVLATAFWLIPDLGLQHTAAVCIGLNVLCALAAFVLLPRATPITSTASPLGAARSVSTSNFANVGATLNAPATENNRLLTALAVTGFLGIGYEILVIRVLSQVAEDTVYTFAMLLAVYLIGSSIGAAIYQRWLSKLPDRAKLRDYLTTALATACLLGTASLWPAEALKNVALQALGTSMPTALTAEALLAIAAFAPPTLVMGALFSHLSSEAIASGIHFGKALGVNTLAASAAPLLFGVLAFPLLGPKLSLVLVALGYLALTSPRSWRKPMVRVPAGIAASIVFLTPRLAFIDVPEGGHVVSYEEGVMAAVSVVEDADGVSRLRIDNRQQEGSSSTLRVDGRQALLPILLHPAPRHALFLGLGTGITASTAAEDPGLDVDAVELLPEVISASHFFTQVFEHGAPNPRLHLISADARRYVRVSDRRYDVIVSDNFHPARSGSGSLYTVEHFEAVHRRLAQDGVFCQWLPLHQLDNETLRSIVQSFLVAFPNGWAMLASNSLETPVLGLVGSADGARFDVSALHSHLASADARATIARLGIEDEFALLGSFIAGPKALRAFAGTAATNTDDHPIVAYRAPRITYASDSSPRERLIALLGEVSIEPAELLARAPDEGWRQRLAAYWAARDRFIDSGRNVRQVSDVRAMLAQVREPLLAVLRMSPDFRPAYDPLLRMAVMLAQTDAADARALLNELAQTQPARPEAATALKELSLR
jgi:spermidine synthase